MMIRKLLVATALPLYILAWNTAAYAESAVGTVHGVTLKPDGAPLPETTVLVHNSIDDTEQSIVSGLDGQFLIVNVKPGRYQLIARKDGFLTSAVVIQVPVSGSAQ